MWTFMVCWRACSRQRIIGTSSDGCGVHGDFEKESWSNDQVKQIGPGSQGNDIGFHPDVTEKH